MTTLPEREQMVLDYLRAEALGHDTSATPLAGLKLDSFRAVRSSLASKGLAVRRSDGRWIPTAMQTSKEREAA